MGNSELLDGLSQLFLERKDPDEAYFEIIRIIRQLNNRGIEVNMKEIQRRAYRCKEVEENG